MSYDLMTQFFFLVCGAVFCAAVFYAAVRHAGKKVRARGELLTSAASALGFRPCDRRPEILLDRTRRLRESLSQEFSPQSISWLFERVAHGLGEYIFELTDTPWSESPNVRQTMYCVMLSSGRLPLVYVCPRGLRHVVRRLLGKKELNITEDKRFSSQYVVLGSSEEEARQLITPEAIDRLVDGRNLTVAAERDTILVYRANVVVSPNDLSAFYHEAKRIVSVLVRGTDSSPPRK
jgi:hypothetical protein